MKIIVAVACFGLLPIGVAKLTQETTVELKAQSMGPVLPLDAPGGDIPALSAALRDPEVAKRILEDDTDANRLASEIKELRSDLTRATGDRAIELNEQTYQNYAILSYYFEDQGSANLAGARNLLIQFAAKTASLSKDPRVNARAQFHMYAAQYLSGQNRSKVVQGLAGLANSKLDLGLKRRAAMIVATAELGGGNKAKAQQTLRGLAASLPAAAQVAVRLKLAQSMKGNAGYRNELNAASLKVQGLPAAEKEKVLGYMVNVWRQNEGQGMQWGKVPFRMTAFGNSLKVKAIIERAALQDWAAGRQGDAIRKYEGIAKALAGQPARAQVDLRLLEMRRVDYGKTKDPRGYERALVQGYKNYLDTGLLGDNNEAKVKAVQAEIVGRHKVLVYGEMSRVATASSSVAEKKRAIAMAGTYMKSLDDANETEGVKAKVANLYVLGNMHREAVNAYKELAETSKSDKVRGYWAAAINSQTVLASWSKDAPWGGMKAGKDQDREELLNLYNKFAEAGGGADWFVAAQAGLLQIQLGHPDQAFASWGEKLKKDSAGNHAANAAGFMMSAYAKASAWGELEAMSRLCVERKVQPLYRNQPLALDDMLALSLLEGGKKAMGEGQFPVAVAKLKEFVDKHPTAKRHDEGFFFLSSAYRGAGKHPESIKVLLAFADKYPSSKYLRDALLNGGDWSAPMAYEENAMFFYHRFVTRFGNDAESARVRDQLTELYLGRELYAEAIGMLNAVVRLPSTPADQKALAVYRIMDIEERHGSMPRAGLAADLLIKGQTVPESMKANAYALKARIAASAQKYDEVRRIEAQIATLGSGFEANEAMGEARYLIAVKDGKSVAKRYFNLALRDPQQTLAQRYEAFKTARAGYQRVCDIGTTSFCAPAMVKLTQMAMEFVRSIEDIEIQNTLAKNVVEKFRAYKQTVYNDVTRTSERADAKAVASLSEGTTDPFWTSAVLWQNTSDWNFDRVSGETGNGYVQWSVSDSKAAE